MMTEKKRPNHVTVKKIENGWIIDCCCEDEQKIIYFKRSTQIPAFLNKYLGTTGKMSFDDYYNLRREEKEEKMPDGLTKVSIKLTND